MKRNALSNMFSDSFYYGMFVNGETITDLRETNPYFRPMILEKDFYIIESRRRNNPATITKMQGKDEFDEIKVFDTDFIVTDDNYGLTFTLPNRKRFDEKIKKFLEK